MHEADNISQRRTGVLIPTTCEITLFGKKDLAGVIKVRRLRGGDDGVDEDYLGWMHKCLVTGCRRGGGGVTMGAEAGRMWPQAKGCRWPPEAGGGQEGLLPYSPKRGHGPADTLISTQ